MSGKYVSKIVALVLLTINLLSGCSYTESPLTVAAFKWPGYESLFLAQREGWFKDSGIQMVEKNSAAEVVAALAAGEVVAATLTLDEVLRAREQGIPLQVVMVFDVSAGSDALITRQPLNSLAALKGLRIGLETSAVGALMLHKVLEVAGLQKSDVELVDSAIDQQVEHWNSDKVDALLTYDPILTQLLHQDAYRLYDSRSAPGLIVDVLAVRSELVSSHRNQLRALTGAHFKVLQRLHTNPQDTAHRMARHLGLTGRNVLSAFRGMQLPDLAVNRKYLVDDGHVVESARAISALMLRAHLLSRQADLTGLVSTDYLPVE